MITEKDKKIIAALKENARASIKDLSQKTKIRPSTIHDRINKLIQDKTIKRFTVQLENSSVDEAFIVFLLMSTEKDLPATFFNNPHIKEVFGITGEYDLMIKLKFKNVAEFNDFILDFRKGKKEIQSTLTMVVTASLKEEI